jgi:hypothetical protein
MCPQHASHIRLEGGILDRQQTAPQAIEGLMQSKRDAALHNCHTMICMHQTVDSNHPSLMHSLCCVHSTGHSFCAGAALVDICCNLQPLASRMCYFLRAGACGSMLWALAPPCMAATKSYQTKHWMVCAAKFAVCPIPA